MNNQKKFAPVIITLIIVALLIGGILTWQYFRVPKEEIEGTEEREIAFLQEDDICVLSKDLNEKYIDTEEREIAFLQEGDIWVLSKDLNEKYIDTEEREIAFLQEGDIWVLNKDLNEKYKIIDIEEKITDFSFSPDGEEIYWLNEKGELWKKRGELVISLAGVPGKIEYEKYKKKVETYKKDFLKYCLEQHRYEGFCQEEAGKFEKLGTIENFELSPDGKYIVYETIAGYIKKEMFPVAPLISLWIINNEGGEKVKVEVERPSEEMWGSFIFFKKWFPDSKRILFYLQGFGQVVSGSPFFEVGIDGKKSKVYPVTGCGYEFCSILETEPFFSPDGSKVVYFDIERKGIWLANIDGSDKKEILKGNFWHGRAPDGSINWSEDGELLAVSTDRKVFVFNREGNIISKLEIPKAKEGGQSLINNLIISPDKKFVAGRKTFRIFTQDPCPIKTIYMTQTLFLANIFTKEIKKFEYPRLERVSIECRDIPNHLFFSKRGNRLYYFLPFYKKEMRAKCPPQRLWAIDINTGENFLIMTDVPQTTRLP